MTVTPDQDVVFGFAIALNGVPFVPVGARLRVTGPSGIVLAWTPVELFQIEDETDWNVTVPAAANMLLAGETRAGRLIDLEVDGGTHVGLQYFAQDYILVQSEDELVVMTNTFQTYVQALTIASGMIDTPGWDAAAPDRRRAALMSAYDDLSHMDFDIYADRDDIYYKSRASWGLPISNIVGRLYSYSPEEFASLLPDFKRKLLLAQVAEADSRLAPDPAASLRDQGVVTNTVGETSMTFRQGKKLDLKLARRTFQLLSPYVKFNTRLSRV